MEGTKNKTTRFRGIGNKKFQTEQENEKDQKIKRKSRRKEKKKKQEKTTKRGPHGASHVRAFLNRRCGKRQTRTCHGLVRENTFHMQENKFYIKRTHSI